MLAPAPFLLRGVYGLLSLLASTAAASPTAQGPAEDALPQRTVVQFEAGVWIENIAVRHNGNLLLTSLRPNASVYEVSGPATVQPMVRRLFTVDDATGLLGIAELGRDVFAFAGGNVTSDGGVQGSFRVWTVDLASSPTSPKPVLSQPIPEAMLLNGMTALPGVKGAVLVSDSARGLVWRVDLMSVQHDIAIQVPEMGSDNKTRPVGVNGIHIRDGHLTWLNHDTSKMYKIAIKANGTPASGAKAEEVAAFSATALDDFTWGPGGRGTAWVTTNSGNRVFALSPSGQQAVVAGASGSPNVTTTTACEFGKTKLDKKVLYVTTGGDKNGGTGGKVIALDTNGFKL